MNLEILDFNKQEKLTTRVKHIKNKLNNIICKVLYLYNLCGGLEDRIKTTEDRLKLIDPQYKWDRPGLPLYMSPSKEKELTTKDLIMAYNTGHNACAEDIKEKLKPILELDKFEINTMESVSSKLYNRRVRAMRQTLKNFGLGV